MYILFFLLWRRHKITEWWSLVRFLLLIYQRRFVCFINLLLNLTFFLNFWLYYYVRLLHLLTFLDNRLSCFLSCFDSKCRQWLIMLTAGLRLFVTLGTTIPFRVVEYYFSLLIRAFDFAKLNFPFLWWHHWEITLTSIWKIENKLPLVNPYIKLSFLSMFTQARVPDVERCESKPWRCLNYGIILRVEVYCTAKNGSQRAIKCILFQISAAELLTRNVNCHVFAIPDKNWAAYWADNERSIFALVYHNLAKVY